MEKAPTPANGNEKKPTREELQHLIDKLEVDIREYQHRLTGHSEPSATDYLEGDAADGQLVAMMQARTAAQQQLDALDSAA